MDSLVYRSGGGGEGVESGNWSSPNGGQRGWHCHTALDARPGGLGWPNFPYKHCREVLVESHWSVFLQICITYAGIPRNNGAKVGIPGGRQTISPSDRYTVFCPSLWNLFPFVYLIQIVWAENPNLSESVPAVVIADKNPRKVPMGSRVYIRLC